MTNRKNFIAIAAVLFAAACSDTSNVPGPVPIPDNPTPPPETFALQVVHASADAPTVNVRVGSDSAQQNLDFKETRIPRSFVPGNYTVSVDANLPDNATDDVIADVLTVTSDFAANTTYTVFAIGGVAAETLDSRVFARSGTVAAGTVSVTALHAADGVDPVNVWVTAPGADLSGETPVNPAPVAFGESVSADIDAGDYQIRITVGSDATNTPVFDSGEVTLTGGTDQIVAAVNNTNAGSDSPVSVLIAGRLGVAEVQDVGTLADARVIHAVPDVGAPVEVLVDGVAAISDFNFTDVVELPDQDPGTYVIQVAAGGNVVINGPTTDEDGNTVDPEETTLAAGVYYDAAAIGSAAAPADEANALALDYSADDRRRLATATKLRLFHYSPSTAAVDIYVVDSATTDISAVDPTFEGVSFSGNTGYVEFVEGSYNIYVTATESKDIVISATDQTLSATGLYTAIARDGVGDAGPGLILLDDFVVPAD